MRGGLQCSVKTRLEPVFDRLHARDDEWVRHLLTLVHGAGTAAGAALDPLDLDYQRGFWGRTQSPLDPPVALLSWLIRHPPAGQIGDAALRERTLLAKGEPTIVKRALHDLRTSAAPKGWHLFDAPTVPDVLLETPDAMVVIESKRATVTPALDTGAIPGRPLIWRNLDAAWEVRGRRRVFGMMIVQGNEADGEVPEHWQQDLKALKDEPVLRTSFPHRSTEEREQIAACFLGATTWQAICRTFDIPYASLPRTIHDLPMAGAGA